MAMSAMFREIIVLYTELMSAKVKLPEYLVGDVIPEIYISCTSEGRPHLHIQQKNDEGFVELTVLP